MKPRATHSPHHVAQLCVAVAVLDGAALIDQYSPARIDADDVWQLLPRITAHHQSDFDAQPLGRGQTRVRVRFTDGQVLESYKFAANSILHPLDSEAVVSKYETLTRRVIDPDRQQEIRDAVFALDPPPTPAIWSGCWPTPSPPRSRPTPAADDRHRPDASTIDPARRWDI
jgi:2-methylcitrate dehydratase PrpD